MARMTVKKLKAEVDALREQVETHNRQIGLLVKAVENHARGQPPYEMQGYLRDIDPSLDFSAQPAPGPPTPPWSPVDLRGRLPTANRIKYPTAVYGARSLDGIFGVTLHYTAAPRWQLIDAVAAYQVSDAAVPQTGAGVPFPGLAYTLAVDGYGDVYLAHDLTTRVWHNAAVVNGQGRNYTHIGIVYTGDTEPNAQQLVGLREAIAWCERQLGRGLDVEGHRDAGLSTGCPGPAWPSWRDAVLPTG